MRTTLDVDEKLMDTMLKMTGEKSKSKAVNKALKDFIRRKTIDELRAMAGKIDLMSGSKIVGELTSSVYSFELGKHIGLGYIKKKFAEIGKELVISNSEAVAVVGEDFSKPKKSDTVQ